jgi:hypothetical protein
MESVVSFAPSPSIEESFAVGPIRAAFAEYWEINCRQPIPLAKIRQLLNRPVPIATVLEFSKFSVTKTTSDIDSCLSQLVSCFYRKLRDLPAPQRSLFSSTTKIT